MTETSTVSHLARSAAEATPEPVARRVRGLSDRAIAWVFIAPTIILLLAINIFPLIWTIQLSFTNYRANRPNAARDRTFETNAATKTAARTVRSATSPAAMVPPMSAMPVVLVLVVLVLVVRVLVLVLVLSHHPRFTAGSPASASR